MNAACEKLQCEPSTVSRAVKALEAELGLPLFEREGRSMKLTDLGKRANQKAEDMLARHDGVKGDKDAQAGVIRIAAHTGIGPLEFQKRSRWYLLLRDNQRRFRLPRVKRWSATVVENRYLIDSELPGWLTFCFPAKF